MLSSSIHNLNNFKQQFISELTIEKFVQGQNGILLEVFKDENREVNIDKYNRNNNFIKSFSSNNLKKSIIQSYELSLIHI